MLQQRMIWFAIAFSTVVYFVIAYVFGPHPEASFDAAAADPIVIACYVLAFLAFLASLFIPRLLVRAPEQTRMILALALSESAAIFGLVAAFVHHDWRLYVAPWVLALIGFTRVWPQERIA